MAETVPNNRTETPANPFRPGNGVRPPYLAGRDRLLAEFEEFTRERPLHANWTLIGLRGTGKTVLLSEFAARAERAGWVTLQREVGERHRDDARLADALEEDVDALLRRLSPLAAVGQAVEEGVRQLWPRRISIGELGYEPAYDERPTESADRMRACFSELHAQLAGSDHPGALLLYDEAHLLADDTARDRYPLSSLLAALGQAQRTEPRIRFVLCGLPTLSLNLKRARTYAERMFRHVAVGNLDRSDAWDALALPLAGAGRSFSLTVIADIVETTGGYPYFLQFFGAYLCRSVATPDVSVDDYRALEPALLHELDLAFFEDRFEGASPTEQRVLEAMGRSHGQVRIGTLRRELADLSGLDLLVRRLIERGLVYRAGRGAYDFALPLFRDYLRRRPKLTELTRSVRRGTSDAAEDER
jgi:AAA ATPase domain